MRADSGRPPRVHKPKKPKLAGAILGDLKQSIETVKANPKAGTQAQRKAARVSYSKKPVAERKQIVRKAKADTVAGAAILHEHASRVAPKPLKNVSGAAAGRVGASKNANVAKPKGAASVGLGLITDPMKFADLPVAAINSASGLHIPSPGSVPKTALAALGNIALATAQSPSEVGASTGREAANALRGVGAAGLGTLRAIGDTVAHPSHVTHLPHAAEKAAAGAVKDYQRRYGDVLSNPKQFRERVKHEGALSYILDAAPELGLGGKAAGEIGGVAARRVAKGAGDSAIRKVARAVTDERPNLRTGAGPGEVRAQDRSSNVFRGAAQEVKDRRRKAGLEARTRKNGGRTPGLAPQEGEVVKSGVIRKTSTKAQERDLHRATAKISSRAGLRTRRDQGREVHGGKESSGAATKHLNEHEADGLKYAIQLGVRDPATATRELAAHLRSIQAERAAGRDFHGDFDEVPVLERILADPERVFTPRLAQVADAERERAKRVAGIHPDLQDEGAVARQHADQAAHLGESRQGTPIAEVVTAARKEAKSAVRAHKRAAGKLERVVADSHNTNATKATTVSRIKAASRAVKAQENRVEAATAALENAKRAKASGVQLHNAEPLAAMIARVRSKAAARGLAEPGYFHGHVYDEGANAPYSGSNVGAAMARDRQYTGSSFAAGRQDTSAEALRLGLARGIKRAHNYRAVADVVDRHAPEWGRGLTAAEAKQAIRARGLDPKSWALIDTGKVRKALDIDGEPVREDVSGTDPKVSHALAKNIYDLDGVPAEYKGTFARFSLMPRPVVNELEASMKPANTTLRGIAKFQGLQSRALLAPNPTFVPVQVVSNTPLAVLAMKGNVRDLLGAQRWYKSLDREARDVVDDNVGASVSHALSSTPRFGDASAGRFTKMWDAVINNQKFREFSASAKNPLKWNELLDEKQNNFFRRAVFYNEAKRSAAKRMGASAADIMDAAPDLMDALRMPSGPERAAALRQTERQAERIGERVDEMLGDFTTYTAAERRVLKTSVMFYGFLRWATRLAFYTLPVKHPIATSIVGKLGQLHNDEVVDLLSSAADDQGIGTKDEVAKLLREDGALSYVFGRSYVMKNGNLEFVDAARLNPLLGPVVDALDKVPTKGVIAGPASAALGLVSPAMAATLDAVAGKSAFTGKDLQNAQGLPLAGEQNTRYIIGNVLRTIYPLRVGDSTLHGRPQSDDSIPLISDRYAESTSPGAIARNKQKAAERGSNANVLLDNLLPMIRTKRDGTLRGIAAELDKKRKADQKKNKGKVRKPRPGELPDLPALPELPTLPSLP